MIRLVMALLLSLAVAGSAMALTPAELGAIGVSPPVAARLPLDLAAVDASGASTTLARSAAGKPAVLVFADYRCRYLCGPALALVAAALSQTRLDPARDYRLVVLGLDPRDRPADASAFGRPLLAEAPKVAPAARLLTAGAPAIAAATHALGYRYRYDPQHDQFAHPAAAFVLAPDGRLVRVLSEIQMQPAPIEAAVRDAGSGGGAALGFGAALHALCYAFDPARGVYDQPVQAMLRVGGVLLLLAAAGAAIVWRRRRGA